MCSEHPGAPLWSPAPICFWSWEGGPHSRAGVVLAGDGVIGASQARLRREVRGWLQDISLFNSMCHPGAPHPSVSAPGHSILEHGWSDREVARSLGTKLDSGEGPFNPGVGVSFANDALWASLRSPKGSLPPTTCQFSPPHLLPSVPVHTFPEAWDTPCGVTS